MNRVRVSRGRVGSVKLGIVVSGLVYLRIGPDECAALTHRRYFCAHAVLGGPAQPPDYTYTVIADVTNCFNVGNPVLNNQGEAAFVANCGAPIGPAAGGIVVRRGDDGPLVEIYTFEPTSPGFSVPDSVISINDHGAVAFPGQNGSRTAILVGDGGPVNAVVDTAVHTQFEAVLRP